MERKGRMVALVALGIALAVGCLPAATAAAVREPVPATPGSAVLFAVQGMTCGSCQQRIRETLGQESGVLGVAVDLGRGTVAVEYDPAAVDPRALALRLTAIGYPARYLGSGTLARALVTAPQPAGGCGGGCCQDRKPGS